MNLFPIPEIDARFVDIGDLPTGFAPYSFKRLFIREFTVAEMKLIYQGQHSRTRPFESTLRALQRCVTVPVHDLTDGDLEYVMAWLRLHSYPKAPMQVSWTCRQRNLEFKDRSFYTGPKLSAKEMELKGIKLVSCDTNNVNIVRRYGTKIETLKSDDLTIPYADIDFARTSTMADFMELLEEHPEMRHIAECARWLKAGDTLADKIELLEQSDMDLYERILECRERYKHGIVDYMELDCRSCRYKWTHDNRPRLLSFFADNTEEDLFKIQYTLLSEFGQQFSPDMPAKMLLFNYSSLAKDKQAAAERKSGFTPLG